MLHFHISLGECLWFVGSVSGWSCANGTLGVGFDHVTRCASREVAASREKGNPASAIV